MGRGEIFGGNVEIRGDVSSQFVSALLLVGPLSKNGVTLTVTTKLESKPYVALTLDVQEEFGVEVEHDVEMKSFRIKNQKYRPTEKTVEGDWSSASFMLAAGALAGDVTIKNLSLESSQADKAIIDILKNMGARVSHSHGGGIKVNKSELAGIEWNLSNAPDLFPVVAALCSNAEGESMLHGLRRLRYKESDRLQAMIEGLKKMGIKITQREDSVSIHGGSVEGAAVNPYMDHRIAMAFGVLGLTAKGETIVTDAECVSKSYPSFWEEIENMGAGIRRENDG
jgi:3-phosphoshikimate 1-carboxyvinyltransferase